MNYKLKGLYKYIVASFVIILAGCDLAGQNKDLLAADAVIEENPDSAMAILSGIPYSDILRDKDKALYTLLYSQAKYKLDRHTSADELDFCVDYYRKHYNPELLQRSYYYRGAINEENGASNAVCINDYKEAERLISENSKANLVYRIYNNLANINLISDNRDEAEYFARKGMEAARKTNDFDQIVNSYNIMASMMNVMGKADSMRYYINKSLKLADKCTDGEKSYLYNNLALFYEGSLNDKETAEKYYKLSAKLANNDNSLFSLALLYMEQGNHEQAKILADKLVYSKDIIIQYAAYDLICEMHLKDKEFLQAYRAREISDSILYLSKFLDRDAEIKEIQAKYDNEVLSSEYKKYRVRTLILLLCIIVVSLSVMLVVLIRDRRKERRIRHLEHHLYDLNKLAIDLKNDKEKTVKEKVVEYRAIVEQKQVTINELKRKLNRTSQEMNDNVTEVNKLKSDMEILFYVMHNEDGILTDKTNRLSFIDCYRNIDEDFVRKIENTELLTLTIQEKLLSILYRIEKTPEEIKTVLDLSNEAYRQLKSRTLKKLKSHDSFKMFCDKIG